MFLVEAIACVVGIAVVAIALDFVVVSVADMGVSNDLRVLVMAWLIVVAVVADLDV